MVTVSALATTLFLGGWRAPWPISLWDGANEGWWPLLWFIGKVLIFMFIFIWLRGTLPRLRYDQFMRLGWKVLIPIALVWTVFVASARATLTAGYQGSSSTVIGALVIAVLLASFVYDWVVGRREQREGAAEGGDEGGSLQQKFFARLHLMLYAAAALPQIVVGPAGAAWREGARQERAVRLPPGA